MSLLNTKTGFTTPWHCSVALMADGEWTSATMADFKNNPLLEIVYENGRPSYFHEKSGQTQEAPGSDRQPTRGQHNPRRLKGASTGLLSDVEAVAVEKPVEMVVEKLQNPPSKPASESDQSTSTPPTESEEEKIIELARTLLYLGVEHEKREFINLFFGSEHPSLDPNSGKFSSKAWLERLASITLGLALRDPNGYPKRVASGT